MKERIFRFKQFSVSHLHSAMKVGVDGVLIGAWASCKGSRMLDVGCGCGLISLMLAQRNKNAIVAGIDIDCPSVKEAETNVNNSDWSDRIIILKRSFDEFVLACINNKNNFDLIVSNPPFYDCGLVSPTTPRELSRHQATLSPILLIKEGVKILENGGKLALIAPSDMDTQLINEADCSDLLVHRICYVRNHPHAQEKRVMIEFVKGTKPDLKKNPFCKNICEGIEKKEHLTLFDPDGQPTEAYRNLCKAFYLKF